MFDIPVFIVSFIIVTLFFSVTAIFLSLVCISMIIGFKNSTHTIEWKPLEAHIPKEDDFAEPSEYMENPNKVVRPPKSANPHPAEEPKDEDPFFDAEDINNTSSHLI